MHNSLGPKSIFNDMYEHVVLIHNSIKMFMT